MKVMGFVNKFNRGISKVKLEMAANGNPAPIFDVNKRTEFRVTLRPAEHAGENRNENRNENRKILEIISLYPDIQRKELAQRTELSRGTLDRKLRELKSGNNPQIEHRGSDKTGGWFIKS